VSTPKEHLALQFAEVARLQKEWEQLRAWGMPPTEGGFQRLGRAIDTAISKVGRLLPRLTIFIRSMTGFAPGELTLWADAEMGWLVEARIKPGAPPVYKYVGDDLAEKVVRKTLTHVEFIVLTIPDPYLGE